jgi:hypothetical protein
MEEKRMTDSSALDALIARLKERLRDADRRTDTRPSIFSQRVQTMSLGDLLSTGLNVAHDLRRVVEANQQGTEMPADLEAKAEVIAFEMDTPAPAATPRVAPLDSIRAVESAIGRPFPPALRRLYGEVADGGFGPYTGLMSLAGLRDQYLGLIEGDVLPRGRSWPRHLLPVVDEGTVLLCVDSATHEERIIAWDIEELDERVSDRQWQHSFSDESSSLVQWLVDWLDGPSPQERLQAQMDLAMQSQIEAARESRRMIAAMTPEQRGAMGLPETGWEEVVWGGLGWDPDESESSRT